MYRSKVFKRGNIGKFSLDGIISVRNAQLGGKKQNSHSIQILHMNLVRSSGAYQCYLGMQMDSSTNEADSRRVKINWLSRSFF
jgi:hypothetical protein